MPKVKDVEKGSFKGENGFIITWEYDKVLTTAAVRFRAQAATAMRFPLTITEIESMGVNTFGDHSDVDVFVPTDGFLSAGIRNPVQWIRHQFDNIDL